VCIVDERNVVEKTDKSRPLLYHVFNARNGTYLHNRNLSTTVCRFFVRKWREDVWFRISHTSKAINFGIFSDCAAQAYFY